MPRLPQPGGDSGNWGTILNDYLTQSHTSDGTLKDDTVGTAQLQDNAVTASTIADNAVTTSALAPDAVTNAEIADGTIQEAQLANGVQTKLNQTAPTWSTLSGKPAVIAAGDDAAGARAVIGAGTSNLTLGLTSGTAKAGDYQPASTDISDSTAIGRSLLTASNAATARTALGLTSGTLADPFRPYPGRIELFPRYLAGGIFELTSGEARMLHFTLAENRTVDTIVTASDWGSVHTGATYCRLVIGYFSEGTYNVLGRTAHNPTRYGSGIIDKASIVDNGAASPVPISSVDLLAGVEYFVALLSVGHTGVTRLCGMTTSSVLANEAGGPRIGTDASGFSALNPTFESSLVSWWLPWVGLE